MVPTKHISYVVSKENDTWDWTFDWKSQGKFQLSHSLILLLVTLYVQVQLANDVISPRLTGTKAILQSILRSLSPHRNYKKKTVALAQQAVDVAVKISALIEMMNEIPQPVKLCLTQFIEEWGRCHSESFHLETITNKWFYPRTLRDLQLFVQFETQSSILHRLFFGKTISARYVVLEERLSTLLVHFEVIIHADILPFTR